MKKKTFITMLLVAFAVCDALAATNDSIMQPTNVVCRVFNTDGTLKREIGSVFSYSSDGKLSRYEIPDYALTANYTYSLGQMICQHTWHQGGWPMFDESLNYSYEDGRVTYISHVWGQMNENEYWLYTYDDDGRLKEKDYKAGEGEYTDFYFYEYAGDGTRVEYYCVGDGTTLRKKTTSGYDEEHRLASVQTDTYDGNGGLTSSVLKTYTYNAWGKQEEVVTMTSAESGEWVNTSVMRYVYDDTGGVAERQDGVWSAADGEWDITKKVNFETSGDGTTYTVSFYKKVNGEWVWDEFANQTVLFEPELSWQQKALHYLVYEDMNGCAHVNQFEFKMELTKDPEYTDVTESEASATRIYPNPASGSISVSVNSGAEIESVSLFDISGRLVKAQQSGFGSIDISCLATGMYVMKVTLDDGKVFEEKIVKK